MATTNHVIALSLAVIGILALGNSYEILRTKRLLLEPEKPELTMALLCAIGGNPSANIQSSRVEYSSNGTFLVWNDELQRNSVYVKADNERCLIVSIKESNAAKEQQEKAGEAEPIQIGLREDHSREAN